MFYEESYTFDGSDVDGRGQCKMSALLNRLQHAGMYAAEVTGFGHSCLLEQYGAIWMLARTWVSLKRPIRYGETLTIRTWHRGGKSALLYRDYDLIINGEVMGEAVSGWVLVHLEKRKLLRMTDIKELAGTEGKNLHKTHTIQRDKIAVAMELSERRTMRYSDIDLNGHVNNTRYADFALDTIYQIEPPKNQFCTQLQIHYIKECRMGEVLEIYKIKVDNAHCLRGVDRDGKTRFEATVIFGEDIH